MADVAISVEHVSQALQALPREAEVAQGACHPRRAQPVRGVLGAATTSTLEVDEGETVGMLGHNGSGKSTLLKCVAGTLRPTTGRIRTRGRVAALLELGAGFHPD